MAKPSPSEGRDEVYLRHARTHARDAISAILEYTRDGRGAFDVDRRTQDAVIRNLEVLGQAVKGLSIETRALATEIEWKKIAGMRDKVIHEYFSVDLPLVWDVVESELPDLLTRVDELLGGNTEREPEAL